MIKHLNTFKLLMNYPRLKFKIHLIKEAVYRRRRKIASIQSQICDDNQASIENRLSQMLKEVSVSFSKKLLLVMITSVNFEAQIWLRRFMPSDNLDRNKDSNQPTASLTLSIFHCDVCWHSLKRQFVLYWTYCWFNHLFPVYAAYCT